MIGTKLFPTGRTIAVLGLVLVLLVSTTTLVLSKPSFVTLSFNHVSKKNYNRFVPLEKESNLVLSTTISTTSTTTIITTLRGGSEYDVDASDDSDHDDLEEEEEEEDATLIQATKSSLKKKKQQTQKHIKETVSASLASSNETKKKRKSSSHSLSSSSSFKIPYILKALLNPFTVIAMTKGYFASLFNIDYLQEVSLER